MYAQEGEGGVSKSVRMRMGGGQLKCTYALGGGGLPRIMCANTMIVPEPEAVTDASHYTSLVERLAFESTEQHTINLICTVHHFPALN